MQTPQPITLTGKLVRLEPLSLEHLDGLVEIGLDDEIWKWMRYGDVESPADMHRWIEAMLELQRRGTDMPFAAIHLPDSHPAGCTRYLNISVPDQAIEIGGTWYGLRYQRTGVNTEAKYLLLRHAFETLHAHRVQIKTDLRNDRSQRAIERLGAVKEGVLREHMALPDGTLRSSVYYSILAPEWPVVKARLERLMTRVYP